jgi:hypothetical protein
MSRQFRFITVGALIGAACAGWIWHGARMAVAAGENSAGVGFGVAHLLFLVSLPWSLAVWALMIGVGFLTGADGPAFLRPFFYAMPVVAGVGWAWAASFIARARGGAPSLR